LSSVSHFEYCYFRVVPNTVLNSSKKYVYGCKLETVSVDKYMS